MALGYFQNATSGFIVFIFFGGALTVVGLHLWSGMLENRQDSTATGRGAWVPVCPVGDLQDKRGKVFVLPDGERAAIFLYGGKISALSNLCAHQNGPLGEGRMLYGCVTCPWHGYQYRPADGRSPPPFTEKVPTYNIAIENDVLMIDPVANAAGTYVEPLVLAEGEKQ